MTRKQGLKDFFQGIYKNDVLPDYAPTTLRCAFVNYIDDLQKNNIISERQAYRWEGLTDKEVTKLKNGVRQNEY